MPCISSKPAKCWSICQINRLLPRNNASMRLMEGIAFAETVGFMMDGAGSDNGDAREDPGKYSCISQALTVDVFLLHGLQEEALQILRLRHSQ